MFPRPPRSTLFPYTMLFRSLLRRDARLEARQHVYIVVVLAQVEGLAGHCVTDRNQDVSTAIEIDRKSTRLNSSHMSISYAVFCLKKKKDILHGNQFSRHELY